MNIRKKQRLDNILGIAMLLILRLPVIILGRLMKRDHSPVVRGDILVIKMLGGGSLVIAYPALLAIRKRYPHHRLLLLTTSAIRPFAETLQVFDEILCVQDRNLFSLVRSSLAAWLHCLGRIDTVVDLEVYSKLTTVFGVLTAARNRIGFYLESTYWRLRIHSHLLFFNRFSGSYYFYDAIALLLDAPVPARQEYGDHFRGVMTTRVPDKTTRRITLGHGCSDFGRERMLTPGQWLAALTQRSAPLEAEYLFLGSKNEHADAEQIIDLLRKRMPGALFRNLCGSLHLTESLAYIDSSDEFWGIDSALLHYARLLGKKTVSFWGPTAPETRLRDEELPAEIHYRKIPCSPCIHVAEAPPCRGNNLCIQALFQGTNEQTVFRGFMVERQYE
jgi:ADP-heptose:LPS heptosyltransferase